MTQPSLNIPFEGSCIICRSEFMDDGIALVAMYGFNEIRFCHDCYQMMLGLFEDVLKKIKEEENVNEN